MNCVVCLTFANLDPRAVSWLMYFIGSTISCTKSFLVESFARCAAPGVSILSETALASETASSIAGRLAPGITFRWM